MESSSEITINSESDLGEYHNYRVISRRTHTVTGSAVGYGRIWFVKSLAPDVRSITQCRQSLRKEYEILLRLNHPGIVRAVDFADIPEAGPSIVMEYVAGETLDEYCRHASLSQKRRIATQLTDTLAYLHNKGTVHCDLKPENIMIDTHTVPPRLCLVDFNLSDGREFAFGKGLGGNRRYGAPEQFEAGYVPSPRADVWSLGKLLQEMRPGADWQSVARRCLKSDPAERPASAAEIVRLRRRTSRLILTTATAVCLIALVGGILFLTLSGSTPPSNSPSLSAATLQPPAPADGKPSTEPGTGVSSSESPTGVTMISPRENVESNQVAAKTKMERPATDTRLLHERNRIEREIAQAETEAWRKIEGILADPTLSNERKLKLIGPAGMEFVKVKGEKVREYVGMLPPEALNNLTEGERRLIYESDRAFLEKVNVIVEKLRTGEKVTSVLE